MKNATKLKIVGAGILISMALGAAASLNSIIRMKDGIRNVSEIQDGIRSALTLELAAVRIQEIYTDASLVDSSTAHKDAQDELDLVKKEIEVIKSSHSRSEVKSILIDASTKFAAFEQEGRNMEKTFRSLVGKTDKESMAKGHKAMEAFDNSNNVLMKTLKVITDSAIEDKTRTELQANKDGENGVMVMAISVIVIFFFLSTGVFILFRVLKNSSDTARVMRETSEDLLTTFELLATSANRQAVALEETAASIEEITGNIKSNTEKSVSMEANSNNTKQIALSGNELVSESKTAMMEINKATKNIAEAIYTIEQIAFQTNILSLNAAVEAATAGEHGRGFAVVAAEVRNLASKSAEAAKQIKDLVSIANHKAERGNQISTEISSAFKQMIEKINETNELVEEVTVANKEQMIGMEQIAKAASELDELTQENVKLTQDTDQMARSLRTLAVEAETK